MEEGDKGRAAAGAAAAAAAAELDGAAALDDACRPILEGDGT